jgi:hypothetical protein
VPRACRRLSCREASHLLRKAELLPTRSSLRGTVALQLFPINPVIAVRDESGVAHVRVNRVEVVAEPRGVTDEGERQKRWLHKVHSRSRFLFVVPRKLVYAETALRLGAEVVVRGRCAVSPAAAKEGPYREGGGERAITLEAPKSDALVVSWRD